MKVVGVDLERQRRERIVERAEQDGFVDPSGGAGEAQVGLPVPGGLGAVFGEVCEQEGANVHRGTIGTHAETTGGMERFGAAGFFRVGLPNSRRRPVPMGCGISCRSVRTAYSAATTSCDDAQVTGRSRAERGSNERNETTMKSLRILLLAVLATSVVAAASLAGAASAKTVVPRAGYYVGHLSSASAATLPVSFYVSKTGQVSKFSFNWVYSTHEAGVAPDYTPKSCSTGQIMSTQPKPVPVKSGKQPSVKATAGFRFGGDFAVQGWFLTASTVEGAISINGPASTCGDLFFRSAFVASWKNASQPKGK